MKKSRLLKRILASALVFMMTFSMLGGYVAPVRAEGEKEERLDSHLTNIKFIDAVDLETMLTGPFEQNQAIGIQLDFRIPQNMDFNTTVFTYDFSEVTTEKGGVVSSDPAFNIREALQGKVLAGSKPVGDYNLSPGGRLVITLNPNEISSIEDMDAFFRFSCALNDQAFQEEGGDYTLKFVHNGSNQDVNPVIPVLKQEIYQRTIDVNKTEGVVDLESMTATFTIEVKNTGDADITETITLHDTMGSNLSYAGLASGSDSSVAVTKISSNQVDFTISRLDKGQKMIIKYTCDISKDVLKGVSWGLDNTVTGTIKENGEDRRITITSDKQTAKTVNTPIEKNIVSKNGSYDKESGNITWTIIINDGKSEYDISGIQLEDTLGNDDGILQTINESEVYLQKYNSATGQWEDCNSADYKITMRPNGFHYTFPNGSSITDKFRIVYTTKPDAFSGFEQFKNKITAKKGTDTLDEEEVPVSITRSFLTKTHEKPVIIPDAEGSQSNGTVEITWKSVITVPMGTNEDVIYRDTVNSDAWGNIDNFVWQDETNRIPEVFVSISEADGSGLRTVDSSNYGVIGIINPYYTQEKIFELSLNKSFIEQQTVGSDKKIIITYKTVGGMDGAVKKTFVNKADVKIGVAKENVQDEAPVKIDAPLKYFDKNVPDNWDLAGVYPDKHMITWRIEFNTGDLDKADLENVEISDTVKNMDFYGVYGKWAGNDDTMDEPGRIYIDYDYWKKYYIEKNKITVTKNGNDTTIKFKLADAVNQDAYNTTPLNIIKKDSGPLYIYYTTVVPQDLLEKYNKTVPFTNNAIMKADDLTNEIPGVTNTVTKTVEMADKVLKKECAEKAEGNQLTYTIDVNPDGLKLCNEKGGYKRFKVIDSLPDGLIYFNKSIQVFNAKTGKPLTEGEQDNQYEFSVKDNDLILMVPDNTPIEIKYKVYMLATVASGKKNYLNSVTIPEPYVENQSFESDYSSRQVSASNAGITGVSIIVEKVSANNPLKTLEGAKFKATEYEFNSNNWQPSGKVYYGETNENGLLSSSNGDGSPCFYEEGNTKPATFLFNNYYEIEEIEAPKGFEKTNKKYKVLVTDGTLTPAQRALAESQGVYIVLSGVHYLFTNTPQNSLEIHKTYWSADGTTKQNSLGGVAPAEIKTYIGDYTLEQCKSGLSDSKLLNSTNQSGLTTSEKIVDDVSVGNIYIYNNIAAGKYTVYESKAADGYLLPDKVYHFTVNEDGTIKWEDKTPDKNPTVEIKNYKKTSNKFTIKKEYYSSDGITRIVDTSGLDKALFNIKKVKDASGSPVAGKDTALSRIGDDYSTGNLEAGVYEITEKTPKMFEDNNPIKITVTVAADGSITFVSNDSSRVSAAGSTPTDVKVTVTNKMKDPVNEAVLIKKYLTAGGDLVDDKETINSLSAQTKFKLSKDGATKIPEMTLEELNDIEGYAFPVVGVIMKNLDPGSYKLEEISAPTNHFIANPVTFTVNPDYTISYGGIKDLTREIVVSNQAFDGEPCRVQLEKNYKNQDGTILNIPDTETKFVYGMNLLDVENATSGSLGGVTVLQKPFTIKNLGRLNGVSSGQESGTFYFKEITNVTGYQKTEGILAFTIEYDTTDLKWRLTDTKYYKYDGGTWVENSVPSEISVTEENGDIKITWDNDANTNKLIINKSYKDINNATISAGSLTEPSEHAGFTLYYNALNNGTYSKYSRQATRKPSADNVYDLYEFSKLNKGYYKLVEEEPAGFIAQPDIYFSVNDKYEIVDGYYLDSEGNEQTVSFTSSAVSGGMEYSYDIENKRKGNSFVFTKKFTDYDNYTKIINNIANLGFSIKEINGGTAPAIVPVGDVSNGEYKYQISNISDGTYEIEETQFPDGYIQSDKMKLIVKDGNISAYYQGTGGDFTVEKGQGSTSVNAVLWNHPKSNSIKIHKRYLEADGVTEIRPSTLSAHAVFKLYKDGEYKKTLSVSGTDYYVTNMEPGSYEIKEDTLSGFLESEKLPIQFSVKDDYTIDIEKLGDVPDTNAITGDNSHTVGSVPVDNKRQGNVFYLKKVYRNSEGTEITNAAEYSTLLNHTKFEVYFDKATSSTRTMSYDSVVKAFKVENLSEGTWYIRETEVPTGYGIASDIRLTVSSDGSIKTGYMGSDGLWLGSTSTDSGRSVTGSLANRVLENQITLTKNYMDGAVKINFSPSRTDYASFRLYMNYGSAISRDVTDDYLDERNASLGKYYLTNLQPGNYTLVETPPYDFKSAANVTFTVKSDRTITNISGATKTTKKTNYIYELDLKNEKQHNSIKLTKQYYNFSNALMNYLDVAEESRAEFKVFKADGTTEVVNAVDSSQNASGVYYIKDLEPGDYFIREVSANGFQLLASDIEIHVDSSWNISVISKPADVTEDSGAGTDRELTISNHALNGIRIEKAYYDTSGVQTTGTSDFDVYKINDASGFVVGDELPPDDDLKQIQDSAGNPVDFSEDTAYTGGALMSYYTVRNLPAGKYVVTEKAEHMYKTPYDKWYLYFEIDDDREISNIQACFDDSEANPALAKKMVKDNAVKYLDVAAGETKSLMAQVTINNYRSVDKNQFEVDKHFINASGTDVTSSALLNQTTFALLKSDNTTIPMKVNTENGKYYVTDLLEGSYTLKETSAPADYELNVTVRVIVGADGKITVSRVGNEADCVISGSETLDSHIKLLNHEKSGKLVITKTIKGNVTKEEAEGALKFKVTNQKTGEEKTYTLKDFTYNSSSKKYTLTLDVAVSEYMVEEVITDIKGYVLSSVKYSVDGGTQKNGKKTTVSTRYRETVNVAYEDTYAKESTVTSKDEMTNTIVSTVINQTDKQTVKTNSNRVISVRTGDDSRLALWLILLMTGLLGMICGIAVLLKTNKNDKS